MSPRPYNLGLRKEASDDMQTRIVSAARELLSADEGAGYFAIDTVAKQADVARMTVYNRFRSKQGLLEAVFDDVAVRGQIMQMPSVFAAPNSLAALDRLVAVFGGFWGSDRLVLRRIRALGTLDRDVGQALRARDHNRVQLVQAVVSRVSQEHRHPDPESFREAVNIVHTLTGFEFFDALAGHEQTPQTVVPVVQRLARAALGLTELNSPTKSSARE